MNYAGEAMAKLVANQYGKARVRVLKILRDGPIHRIKDIAVAVLLDGDFGESYTTADNSKVVPTDTIKNTVQILAKHHLGDEIERFAVALGQHFLTRYPQVARAEVEIEERKWEPLSVGGNRHPHSFAAHEGARMFTQADCTRASLVVHSGVRELLILKSTQSGFENYPKDEFTTLKETADRILATSFSAKWTFDSLPEDCRAENESILAAMLKIFAGNYSPSAQRTLFEMGEAALSASGNISKIELAMPNKHCLLIDLSPFGLENRNEVFIPTDEPHGQIEATLAR